MPAAALVRLLLMIRSVEVFFVVRRPRAFVARVAFFLVAFLRVAFFLAMLSLWFPVRGFVLEGFNETSEIRYA